MSGGFYNAPSEAQDGWRRQGQGPEVACRPRCLREVRVILASRATWSIALGVFGVGLACLGVGLMASSDSGSAARAQPATARVVPVPGTTWAAALAPAAGPNVIVSATPMGDSSVVICVVDTAKERLAVYVADARRSRLKLLAVRDISADWALTDYNNDPPLPKDVRARIESLTEKGGGPPASEETPAPSPVP